MTLSEYRNSSSWQGAIELGPDLMRLAEELPASEEMGLSYQLRQIMVELPAAVASDLVLGTQLRNGVSFRLVAALEIIDRVYPALDTAGTRSNVDAVIESFETKEVTAATPSTPTPAPAPEPEPSAAPLPYPADVPLVEGDTVALEQLPQPQGIRTPETTVLPDGSVGVPSANNLSGNSAPITTVPVTTAPPSEEVNVQPNSGQ